MVPLVSAKLENAAPWARALFFPWGPLTDLLCEPGPYLLSEAPEQNRAKETDLSLSLCVYEHEATDCARDAVNTATVELTSSVVHWKMRDELDGLNEANFY